MTVGSVDISYTWPNLLSNVGSAMDANCTVLEEDQEEA